MEIEQFFISLMLILFVSRLLGECAARFDIPSVIGELLAGVILGPSLLNWIQFTDPIKLLAELGLVLLLFDVGLESDLVQLSRNGSKAFLVATVGVVAPLILGFTISYTYFDLPVLTSLFVGGALTATSIGITVRILSDLKKQSSQESQIVLGAAVIDDIIGIILLSLLYEFSEDKIIDWVKTCKIIFLSSAFLFIAPIIARILSRFIGAYERLSEIPGLVPSCTVSLVLLLAWLAHIFEAPDLLGGFAAGLAFSHLFPIPSGRIFQVAPEFLQRVNQQMRPIIHLFTPIFFVSIGLSLNLREVAWDSSFVWLISSFLLVAAFVGKLCSGLILFSENKFLRWAVGLAMIPRGEVGLIFANFGRNVGVFSTDLYAAIIIVITLTTFLAPFLMRWFYSKNFDKSASAS